MATSRWHKLYAARIAASPAVLFGLLSDLPNYGDWLPPSDQFGQTTDVTPYPVQLGTRYHDGKPTDGGNSWWGTVTGFQSPGSLDFHHTLAVNQLRATVDVRIHYSLEPHEGEAGRTMASRWLMLDIDMPLALRPLRGAITAAFDKENVRTMAAIKRHAERSPSPVGT